MDDNRDPTAEEMTGGKRSDWAIADFVKKALLAGVGAVFMTEEGVRSLVGEMKMPKEAMQFVLNQVSRTKRDLFETISVEMRTFLESSALSDQFRRTLSNLTLDIHTQVRFIDNTESGTPEIQTKVKVNSEQKSPAADSGDEP